MARVISKVSELGPSWPSCFLIALFHSSLTAVHFVSTMVMLEKQPVGWKEYCTVSSEKNSRKLMDKCTCCCNITEINHTVNQLEYSPFENIAAKEENAGK